MSDAKEYRFHPLAWQELAEADSWYLSHSYEVSLDFLNEIYAAVEDISRTPRRWPTYLYGTRRLSCSAFPSPLSTRTNPS